MALLMSCGGVVWGGLAGALGMFWPCIIPLSYAAATAANLAYFRVSRDFENVRFLQVLMSLLLPFLFQWSIGGFGHSGAGMLWAMLAILGSLTFGSARQALAWLGTYCLLTIISGLIDARVLVNAPEAPADALTLFFVLNIVAISTIVFGLTIWLLHQRDLAIASAEKAREKLTHANQTLEETNRDLQVALEAAQAATLAKSRFLANMSHELRTPLNAVLGMSELLSDTELGTLQREYIETIESSGEALLALVSDILDLSKIEAGALILELHPVDIGRCARRTVRLVEGQARAKGLAMHLEIDPKTPGGLLLDQHRFRQIILNLLSNAVKFTEHGSVTLRVGPYDEPGQPGVVCEVVDTGVGIDPQMIETLMQPFVQADASVSRRYGGTGLGLAISRNLAELHGGGIQIESEIGRGSVFRVRLPAEPCEVPKAEHPTPAPVPTTTHGRLRILLVEDNAVNQMVAVALLRKLGWNADVAVNGLEAVEAVANKPYDVVLLDVMMPVMDGLEAARRIRAMDLARPPVLIAVTANVLEEDRERCREAGMTHHIAKPFRQEALRIAILDATATVRSSQTQ